MHADFNFWIFLVTNSRLITVLMHVNCNGNWKKSRDKNVSWENLLWVKQTRKLPDDKTQAGDLLWRLAAYFVLSTNLRKQKKKLRSSESFLHDYSSWSWQPLTLSWDLKYYQEAKWLSTTTKERRGWGHRGGNFLLAETCRNTNCR